MSVCRQCARSCKTFSKRRLESARSHTAHYLLYSPVGWLPKYVIKYHTNALPVAPVAHCHAFTLALGSLIILVFPSTCALFFLRVRAVYCNGKLITIFFGVLWLVFFALCLLIPQSISAVHIGMTQTCIVTKISPYVSAPIIMHVAFDTLVFFSISFRVISFSIVGDTFSARMMSFFRGDGLSSLPRSLLFGGQVYYVLVIRSSPCTFTNIFACSPAISLDVVLVVMVLAPISRVYPVIFVTPHLALDSAMACRVFRGLKLGYISDTDADIPKVTSLRFAQNTTNNPGSLPAFEGRMGELKYSRNEIVIDIKKERGSKEIGNTSAKSSGAPILNHDPTVTMER